MWTSIYRKKRGPGREVGGGGKKGDKTVKQLMLLVSVSILRNRQGGATAFSSALPPSLATPLFEVNEGQIKGDASNGEEEKK